MPLLRIDAAPWYRRKDFQRYVCGKHTATWHNKALEEFNDYSDVFFTFSNGDSSDYPGSRDLPGIPTAVFKQLEKLVEETYGTKEIEILVWVANLPL